VPADKLPQSFLCHNGNKGIDAREMSAGVDRQAHGTESLGSTSGAAASMMSVTIET
jgi:hypothetical protein